MPHENNDDFLHEDQGKDSFIPISDLMSGLMIIFLFIAVIYMKDVVKEKDRIEKVVVMWNQTQESLYKDLWNEFKTDLPKWKADIDRKTLSVRFKEPSVFFDAGSSELPASFRSILSDFFPRYLKVLQTYKGNITEVRIEGHTSSEWAGAKGTQDAYFRNMELSQNRTRAVLEYCLKLPETQKEFAWAKKTITANGLSNSQPILLPDGREDTSLCRRVEFRARTDAEQRIVTILRADKTIKE